MCLLPLSLKKGRTWKNSWLFLWCNHEVLFTRLVGRTRNSFYIHNSKAAFWWTPWSKVTFSLTLWNRDLFTLTFLLFPCYLLLLFQQSIMEKHLSGYGFMNIFLWYKAGLRSSHCLVCLLPPIPSVWPYSCFCRSRLKQG